MKEKADGPPPPFRFLGGGGNRAVASVAWWPPGGAHLLHVPKEQNFGSENGAKANAFAGSGASSHPIYIFLLLEFHSLAETFKIYF